MSYLRRAFRNAQELDKDYGKGFGTFFYVVLIVAITIFLTIAGLIFRAKQAKDSNEEFLLDSPSKYRIVLELPSKSIYYYEVDLTEGSVVKRNDGEDYKRQKIKTINTDTNLLGKLLNEVTSDENNIGLTAEEREKIHSQGCHWIFSIETSSGETYYIKDVEQITDLRVLIDET